MGRIRVGIGGWTYAPWRRSFYPAGLAQARELWFAAQALTSIEINGTYYRLQSRDSFKRWADETPSDFVFAVKAHRLIASRRRLAEGGEWIARFIDSGLTELGSKLGPVLWQLAPTKAFDEEDLGAFVALLPQEADGLRLRHAIEARHPSFANPRFLEQLRARNVALCCVDAADRPGFADATADFVYARLRRAEASHPAGYEDADLERWTLRLRAWESGQEPVDLPRLGAEKPSLKGGRDVFAYVINGAKERAPAAAMALIERLRAPEAVKAAPERAPKRRK